MARKYDDDEEEDDIGTYKDPKYYRRRRPIEDYEEDALDPEDELIIILKAIDYTRSRLDCHQVKLAHLFRRYPDLQEQWRKFTRYGGLSADDFRLFLKGQLRPRITRQRKHLRLVSNRKAIPVKLRKTGNDVA